MTKRRTLRTLFLAAIATLAPADASSWSHARSLFIGIEPRSVVGAGYIVGGNEFGYFNVRGVAPGSVITLDIVARVGGTNGLPTDEALRRAAGSWVSDGSNLTGTLSVQLDPAWSGDDSSNGASVDLDGDGDLDVGSNDPTSANGFFNAVTTSPQQMEYGSNFKLGTAQFEVSAVTSATAEAFLHFVPRSHPDASVHIADGQTLHGAMWGHPWTLVSVVPEPSLGIATAAALTAGFISLRRRSDPSR